MEGFEEDITKARGLRLDQFGAYEAFCGGLLMS